MSDKTFKWPLVGLYVFFAWNMVRIVYIYLSGTVFWPDERLRSVILFALSAAPLFLNSYSDSCLAKLIGNEMESRFEPLCRRFP